MRFRYIFARFWRYSEHAKEGEDCCSRWWISCHYVKAPEQYKMHERVLKGLEAGGKQPSELKKL